MFGSRNKKFGLNELGSVELPSRLESRGVQESAGHASFRFDRTSGSLFMMGSNRPINEQLILTVWANGHRDAALLNTQLAAPERTTGIVWRREGDYDVGEGTHEVNASKHKAWIVTRESAEKHALAAYMVWDKTQSLAEAKRTVDQALASLHFDRPIAEYLRLASDRPAKIAATRRTAFQKLLDEQKLGELKLGGPIIERNGGFYQLFQDNFHGETFHGLHGLGDLPSARHFRVNNSDPPKGVSNWPIVCRFDADTDGWKPDCEITLTAAMLERLNARHLDRTRSYFYAAVFDLPADATETSAPIESTFRCPYFWRALEPMKARFAKGEMVEAVRN